MNINREECEKILQVLIDNAGSDNDMMIRRQGLDIINDEERYNDILKYLAAKNLILLVDTIPLDGSPKRFYPRLTKEGVYKINQFGISGALSHKPVHPTNY